MSKTSDVYITPSLLDSLDFLLNCPEIWKESANEGFLSYLKKLPFERTEAMQLGIDYENLVMKVMKNEVKSEDPVIKKIVNICEGSNYQRTVKKIVEVNDIKILLYGKCDFVKDDIIYDLKRGGYKRKRKYKNKMQHHIYMYCSGIKKFEYLISTGDNLFTERYKMTINTERKIINSIKNFLMYIENRDLLNTYLNLWKSKY